MTGHGGFADGIRGTIAGTVSIFPGIGFAPAVRWVGGARVVRGRLGPVTLYLVEFDAPQDDGSGDGPYRSGEIAEVYLRVAE